MRCMAVTDQSRSTRNFGLYRREGHAGISSREKRKQTGLARQRYSELIFTDCRVPADNLLGSEGEGFINTLQILDGGRISIASMGLGMAQGAYEASIVCEGAQAIWQADAEFQAIQFKLADMATRNRSRAPAHLSGCLARRSALASGGDSALHAESSMAKLYAGEVAVRVANEAVQIHGGYGFIKDYPVEKYYRDVKLCTIGEGTSEIQRMVIARQLLG